jgi:heme-degrading monooxygenase HmoA
MPLNTTRRGLGSRNVASDVRLSNLFATTTVPDRSRGDRPVFTSTFSAFSTDRNLANYMVLYRPNPAASGDRRMFIAMNRFRVIKGSEGAFEHVWLSRDSHLEKVPGFVEFHLLKGPEAEDHTLYASHTVWKNRAVFEAWTKSEAFRAAHSRAGDNKPLYLGHPQFEGFEVCQTVRHGKAEVA